MDFPKSKNNQQLDFLNQAACFDLQFRKDIRKKRINSPVYYSWKAQFVIAMPLEKENQLKGIQEKMACGRIHYPANKQVRFSVQKINDLFNQVIPFFKFFNLNDKKNYDFELWAEAVNLIYNYKGQPLTSWIKKDFLKMIQLQKEMSYLKNKKGFSSKWISEAMTVAESLCLEN